jgi:hypothetical protein
MDVVRSSLAAAYDSCFETLRDMNHNVLYFILFWIGCWTLADWIFENYITDFGG